MHTLQTPFANGSEVTFCTGAPVTPSTEQVTKGPDCVQSYSTA